MKYKVITHTAAEHPFAGEAFLFNTEKHLCSQPGAERYTFDLVNIKTELSEARFTMFLKGNNAFSPLRAPFGSLEFLSGVPFHYLEMLLKEVDKLAYQKQLKSVTVVSYPTCYAPENSQMLHYLFTACGYSLEFNELNFHICPDARSFMQRIVLNQRQELKKCREKGYTSNYGQIQDLEAVYDVISRARKHKGYPLTLSLEQFKGLPERFPDDFTFFYVKNKEKYIAVTLGVRVNSRILYNFFMAADPDYKSDSPTIMLLEELYNYAHCHGYEILDYGMASEKGAPNHGLIRFKERTGGIPSLKPVFKKNIRLSI
ncbi:GNAT family N-acetyltransferase [Cytophagaceae bacterium ABcell3]|nr:GNAT family N-acetyltransferase [Cytophagaceae bacterium ABcell3]